MLIVNPPYAMKNSVFVLALTLVTVSNVYSQKTGDSEQGNTSSYITFSPLSLLDFHAPRLRFGYTQHIAGHWKIGIDLGFGSGTGLLSRRESEDDFLFEIRPEVHFILKPEARTIKYISAEFFYIGQSNTLLNNVYDLEEGLELEFDQADYERQKFGMHLKYGLFLNFGSHWGLNFYGGIGFRWTEITFSNVINARENTTRHRGHGYETIYDAERNDFRPNPTLGVKLFYRF